MVSVSFNVVAPATVRILPKEVSLITLSLSFIFAIPLTFNVVLILASPITSNAALGASVLIPTLSFLTANRVLIR